MFVVGVMVGAIGAAFPLVVWLDRRDEARRRMAIRVDQRPMPMPGAYERVRPRVLTSAQAAPVFDGTPELPE
jgi:hypothetical protein